MITEEQEIRLNAVMGVPADATRFMRSIRERKEHAVKLADPVFQRIQGSERALTDEDFRILSLYASFRSIR